MPGKPINQQQVNLYMSYRNQPNHSQSSAAAKARTKFGVCIECRLYSMAYMASLILAM